MRTASVDRKTHETEVSVEINLDGTGNTEVATGIGFFDHMLILFGRHALVDLGIKAQGDLQVDAHHTVEDVGLCLGAAVREALGDKSGITRYGDAMLPMDDALVSTALDMGGRPHLVWRADFPSPRIGDFDTELVREFCQAWSNSALANLHVILHHGVNSHHIAEAIFKSLARSFRQAIEVDPRQTTIPSTKGKL